MKKRKSSFKELKPIKLGFQSSVSLYKINFFEKEMTFRPKFSVTKNLTFSKQKKVANNLARAFVKFKPQ